MYVSICIPAFEQLSPWKESEKVIISKEELSSNHHSSGDMQGRSLNNLCPTLALIQQQEYISVARKK